MAKKKKTKNAVKQRSNSKKKATKASWKPGQSGNPKGRPPAGESWAEILRQVGEETYPRTGKPFKEAVSRKIWNMAAAGDIQSIKEIMNRMDGMPQQNLGVEGSLTVVIDKSLEKKQ